MQLEKKIKEYENFLETKDPGVTYSKLWKEFKNDFNAKSGNDSQGWQRRYGINKSNSESKVNFFIRIYQIANKLIDKFSFYSKKLTSYILSLLILGDFKRAYYYRLDHKQDMKKLTFKGNRNYEREYKRIINKELKWSYSGNTFKSFCYYQRLLDFINIESGDYKKFLEIGSGLCNFAMILTSQIEEYTYLCVDIPEMIPNGYLSLNKYLKEKENVEIFLPHESDKGFNSKSKKKFIFLLPSQLSDINIKVDGFINHESFAEMTIKTVNSYLKQIINLTSKDSFVFLVNRLSRCVDSSLSYPDSHTEFNKYYLEWLGEVIKEIDSHRKIFMGNDSHENILYIGKKLN